jgi:hypothetical protein
MFHYRFAHTVNDFVFKAQVIHKFIYMSGFLRKDTDRQAPNKTLHCSNPNHGCMFRLSSAILTL